MWKALTERAEVGAVEVHCWFVGCGVVGCYEVDLKNLVSTKNSKSSCTQSDPTADKLMGMILVV